MKKYKEIAEGLGLNELSEKIFNLIYKRVAEFSNQFVSGNPLRMTDESKQGLIGLASASINVGSTSAQYRQTRETVMSEGISDDRLPLVITGASLAYIVDRVVERFNQDGKSVEKNPRLLYQALDFLTLDEVIYLGL